MLWPADVVIGSTWIPLDEVRADVQIHHGRTGAFDAPTASTCQLVLLEVTRAYAAAFRVGEYLRFRVSTNGGAPVNRFFGRITDAYLDADTLTVVATGKLSELGQYEIGLYTWPQETWSARLARIFDEADLDGILNLDTPTGLHFDPVLAARDVSAGPTTLADELNSLASMVGASVTDGPDGRIVVQPLDSRDFSESTLVGHEGDLDPADVAYAPVWSQVLPGGNIVTVVYTPGSTLPTRSGALTDGSPTVTGLASTLDILPGMSVTGAGIPHEGTFVENVVSPSSIVLTRPANTFAQKDGEISPGETEITGLSDTSDLSVGMTVVASGDLQPGTVITEIESNSVKIDKPAVGTTVGQFTFSAPASSVLTFGVQTAWVTHQDDASVARYGKRPVQIDTTFKTIAAADQRATERLARAANPRWNIPAAPILRGLSLKIGRPVELHGLPVASPVDDWVAILEGWSETITGDEWTMELALSDPALSGFLLFDWNTIPSAWAWNELDPDASWDEATTLEGITP